MVSVELREELRKNLPYIRIVWGWTQDDLADFLDVSHTTIVNIENEENRMSTIQYYALRYWADGLTDLSRERYKFMYVLESDRVRETAKEELKKRIDSIVRPMWKRNGLKRISEKVVDEIIPFCDEVVVSSKRRA